MSCNLCLKNITLLLNINRINKINLLYNYSTFSIRDLEKYDFNWKFLLNTNNTENIRANIKNRKGIGNIDKLLDNYASLKTLKVNSIQHKELVKQLLEEAFNIPNKTHPLTPIGDEHQSKQIAIYNQQRDFDFSPKSSIELGELNKLLQTKNVGYFSGSRTYHLMDDLAYLENALIRYTLDTLINSDFKLISVPDFVLTENVESCGFKTAGKRTQVFKISPGTCLSGTGEMPLASFLKDKIFDHSELPLRLATVSRCYRAETSDIERERGLYRVHHFTKVEMFGVTSDELGNDNQESDQLLEEFLQIQIKLFDNLNIHFRVLDMASQELGSSAYRKFDIETWLPAKKFWGEISSASNCTDYQTRRLKIKYKKENGQLKHCHTINGTACAIPRMIITLLENNQLKDGSIIIPHSLQPYFKGSKRIEFRDLNNLSQNLSESFLKQ